MDGGSNSPFTDYLENASQDLADCLHGLPLKPWQWQYRHIQDSAFYWAELQLEHNLIASRYTAHMGWWWCNI